MAKRKQRTREHIIADLSTNYVERLILVNGFSVERVEKDYGYDLIMFTYDSHGEIENGQVYLQLKATDKLHQVNPQSIAFSVATKDLNLWINEPLPVFFILYDAAQKTAYWLYIQAYFAKHQAQINLTQQSITLYFSVTDKLTETTVKQFRQYKNAILKQLQGRVTHHV